MGLATFNWTFKSGTLLPFSTGASIPTGADDVRTSGVLYVSASFGNDSTGNGSRKYPYKTINKAATSGFASGAWVVVGSGTYREYVPLTTVNINGMLGDGNVIIDLTLINNIFWVQNSIGRIYNLTFRGGGFLGSNPPEILECRFLGVVPGESTISNLNASLFKRCVVAYTNVNFSNVNSIRQQENITYYRCNVYYQTMASANIGAAVSHIFVECNLVFQTQPKAIDFSLFFNCNFRFNSGALPAFPSTFYPSVPSGFTYLNTIDGIRAASVSAFGAAANNFNNCICADPLFNNAATGDYSIGFTSPAKNRSYFGTYIGAYSISRSLKIKSSASVSDFDNSSAVNLNIVDDSLTLVDSSQIASIITKPIDNTSGREISRIPTFGYNADRNGEFVDATSDLDTVTIAAGVALSASTPYFVEVGAITYNSQVYQPGDRFTTLVSSPGTFTTSTGGVVREILEAPARENLQARFSDGAVSTIDNTGALTVDAWYYVEGNSVTYNGTVYAVGAFFKCVSGVTSFTGSGVVREVFTNADSYFYFEINQKPTSNNAGNVRTGAIVRGNGDKDFDRTLANVFPITKKFIQIKYTIQVNNLRP